MTERSPLDLRALRVFVEVATSGSMTIAASRLGLTQSAVSQTVRRLEGELGVALVVRGSRPVVPTAAGMLLRQRAEPLLRDAAQLAHAVTEAGSTPAQELRLGLVDTFASTAGPELIRVLTGAATRVVVWSGLAPSLGEALIGRQVDAIVTSDPLEDMDGLLRFPLWREPFVLLLPRSLPAPGSPTAPISLDTLAASLPMIRYSARSHTGRQIERHLRRVGCGSERRIEIDGSDALVAMVAAGIGWAITTPLCLLQGAASAAGTYSLPLPSPGFSRTLSLLCREDGPAALARHAAAAAFGALRDTCLPRLRGLAPALADAVTLLGGTGVEPPDATQQ